MKETDDLTAPRLAAGAINANAEKSISTASNSSDEVVTTALLRKIWVRRMLNELGEQCSCGHALDSGGRSQSDDRDQRAMHNSFVVGKLTLIAQQVLLGLDEVLRAIALIDELPAARCDAEADARWKIQGILNLLCVRLARAELAAQHVLPSGGEHWQPR